jgi:putative NADH-flavin reductase
MKLAVFGATGPTGLEIVKQALERGHEVTALARDPARLSLQHERLSAIKGDVFDPATLERVISGKDAVLSALGVKVGLTGAPHTTIYSDTAKGFITAMRKTGVKRLVYCTSGGVEDHDPNAAWFYEHIIKPVLLQKGYDDMKIAEAAIWGAIDIDWVVVRPTRLTDGPKTGSFRVSPRFAPEKGTDISRADLASFMLDRVSGDQWVRKTPTLAY